MSQPKKKIPSRQTVFAVLEDSVSVDSPTEVMIVDRGLLRWAMAMTAPRPERASTTSLGALNSGSGLSAGAY